MKILLVGMYPADQQYSLTGFAGALAAGLPRQGCEVRLITPRVVLNKINSPGLHKWLGHADKFILFPRELKRAAKWADVVHLVDHGHAVYVKHLQRVPHLITCHDLIAAKAAFGELPEWSLAGTARVYQQMILEGLRQAQRVACISEATRGDVIRLAQVSPTRTALIYDALFHPYSPMPEGESTAILRALGLTLDDPYLLHIGRDAPTKNRRGVIEILKALRAEARASRMQLVLAGKPLTGEMRRFIRDRGLEEAVVELSHLRDEQIQALYSRAAALVFPSYYEGFGMPIIEAQACGCPVFTSDRSPMTEVGGAAAIYFDPTQPAAAAQAILKGLCDRDALVAAGYQNVKRFTPAKMLDGYLEAYRHVLETPRNTDMRILHVIASANREGGGPIEGIIQLHGALTSLGHHSEVVSLDGPDEAWIDAQPIRVHALGGAQSSYRYSRRLVPWLTRHALAYEYVVVNGLWQYTGFAVRQVMRRLGRPYVVYPHGMLDPWFKRTYPIKHLKKSLYWPWAEYKILRDAHAVCFTCEDERLLARRSFGPYRCNEVVVNYGTSAPTGDPDVQREMFLSRYPALRGKRLLLFLSRIHVKKGCDLLLDAFAQVAAEPSLHLVMAGPDRTGWVPSLQRQAARLGITDRVTWPGMLSGELKWGAFHAAEAFVLPSHQENFGIAVAEALACGLPVLISNKVNIWREIQADGAGLATEDTADGAARLLRDWLALPASERDTMRQHAEKSFRERFEITNAAKSLLRILQTS